MKDIIKFIIFIIYCTSIFFFPNNNFILIFILLNVLTMILTRKHIKSIICGTLKILPFVILTFIFNYILDEFMNAVWISIKLLIVCNITMAYSTTTTVMGVAETIKSLCFPLKLFKINTDEIKMIVCISLSMIPILRKDLNEMKDACRAKGIKLNVNNMKTILSKFCLSMLIRVQQMDEALIAKGQKY